MIRMTLALLVCIGVTMIVAGRDLDDPMGSDDPAAATASDAQRQDAPVRPNRLSLDDDAGAIARALDAAATPAAASAPGVADDAEPAASSGNLHLVTGNRVNIRSGPSTSDPVVDQVVRDQRVDVLDETPDGWMRIRVLDTGTEAFIFGRFLTPAAG